MPELSIIVPVYKVEKYLPRCIDSILAQTFRDFELILIDDGSPDNCGAICDEYAAQDSRIRVIHQPNAGVSAARNAGLDIATGAYLGFVDSDDWIEPEMYETMIATAKEKQVDVVVCGVNYCEEDGTFIRSDLGSEGSYDKEQMLFALYGMPNPLGGGCCNKVFRHQSIMESRFRKNVAMAEDWLFLFDSFCILSNCEKKPWPFYNVVERADSATRCGDMELTFEAIASSRLLLLLSREHSYSLECKATDKFLDDCLRFAPQVREIGSRTGQPYRLKLLQIKWLMVKILVRAYFHKLLPKAKIHGYIMGMIKL